MLNYLELMNNPQARMATTSALRGGSPQGGGTVQRAKAFDTSPVTQAAPAGLDPNNPGIAMAGRAMGKKLDSMQTTPTAAPNRAGLRGGVPAAPGGFDMSMIAKYLGGMG